MSISAPLVHAIPGFCQPISALSHLLGAGVALVAAVPLVRLGRGCPIRTRALTVYAACVVAALAISGSYHALPWQCTARNVMQRLDHFAIWLLIAGTFTAVHGVMCQGFWRRGILMLVWGYASCGVLLQVLWFEVFGSRPGVALYLGFGWLGLLSVVKVGRLIGFRAVRPILYSGVAITAGALLETFARRTIVVHGWISAHEIFHFCVIGGLLLHWLFVRNLLLKHQPPVAVAVAATA